MTIIVVRFNNSLIEPSCPNQAQISNFADHLGMTIKSLQSQVPVMRKLSKLGEFTRPWPKNGHNWA